MTIPFLFDSFFIKRLNANLLFNEYLTKSRVLLNSHIWVLYGCCMDFVWILYGCCMGVVWILYDIFRLILHLE